MSKPEQKLTRRLIDNERARLAKKLAAINNRLAANTLGELDPPLTPAQVASGKFLVSLLLPQISAEDVKDAAQPVQSTAEIIDRVAASITDKTMLDRLVAQNRAAAIQCRDYLTAVLDQPNVVALPERVA